MSIEFLELFAAGNGVEAIRLFPREFQFLLMDGFMQEVQDLENLQLSVSAFLQEDLDLFLPDFQISQDDFNLLTVLRVKIPA